MKNILHDRNMSGPDHKTSLEPDELALMVSSIRNIEKAIGTVEKKATSSEIKNRVVVRKSIVASCYISEGEILSVNNITVKRPANGLSPMLWNDVIGTKAVRTFEKDELIEL